MATNPAQAAVIQTTAGYSAKVAVKLNNRLNPGCSSSVAAQLNSRLTRTISQVNQQVHVHLIPQNPKTEQPTQEPVLAGKGALINKTS